MLILKSENEHLHSMQKLPPSSTGNLRLFCRHYRILHHMHKGLIGGTVVGELRLIGVSTWGPPYSRIHPIGKHFA
jgi:hypothetical protein